MTTAPGPGHNVGEINYASEEVQRLGRDYAETTRTVQTLAERFDAAPAEIEDEDGKRIVSALIRDMRDAGKRIEGMREAEKTPHYRRGQGVDQFFFGLADRLFKREKRGMNALGDTLQARLTAYDTMLLRQEEERRRQEAERLAREAAERARIEREAREREERQRREAEEARLKAERARKAENIAAHEQAAAAADAQADQTASEAASKAAEAEIAQGAAEAAYVETLARPADIMRQRDQTTGVMTTMQREFYAEVESAMKLDKELLWPFISLDAKEKALRAWAKANGHSQQMEGARIGSRPKSVVR